MHQFQQKHTTKHDDASFRLFSASTVQQHQRRH